MLRNRVYKSGTGIRWCLWRWSDAQLPYLDRLFLFKTPWFAVSINFIKQADVGLPHDHTSAFLSIFLKGWYRERRIIKYPQEQRGAFRRFFNNIWMKDFTVKRRFWNYMRGCDWDAHRILDVSPGGQVSICFMGPKVREWGYHAEDGSWIHWSEVTESEHK